MSDAVPVNDLKNHFPVSAQNNIFTPFPYLPAGRPVRDFLPVPSETTIFFKVDFPADGFLFSSH
jgi:hypothetical protein